MSRYIDTLPTPAHVEPKKLIVLSAPRTGTHGLYNALKLLGYKPYHMVEVLGAGPKAGRIMREGLEGEIGQRKPYTRKEFDKWFADYDIIIEMPFFMLRSMLKAYPDAKFLLVQRSPEKWAKSYENTIGKVGIQSNRFPFAILKYFDGFLYELNMFSRHIDNLCTKGAGMTDDGRKALTEHYKEYIATVKRLVPPEQLKVITLEDGLGWEEICPYLGCPGSPEGNDESHDVNDDHRGRHHSGWRVLSKGRRSVAYAKLA
ncbi:hypothetical protein DL766_004884 [Monosporascus sp. MC13-8B]|uniref:Sulfotransferase domain-containing protein n=1 Tax=Monosporascus cannonballus TaxID=155416 RepID=A0ABY0GZ45_9PEZI|nr:hypothetical protein DL762_008576 [Monosporascus cannonballus]RYP00218.1 hypothetical protein DL763_000987 [Monosporascus cannonballus]RYP30406.1 hypothetical protein DL766_004884 [Monosporascus sp. MC13-8B]